MSTTQMNLAALERYKTELESFKADISKHCSNLETGIDSCSNYMLDENSKKALKKGQQVADDIKSCLHPAQMILETLYHLIDEMKVPHDFIM